MHKVALDGAHACRWPTHFFSDLKYASSTNLKWHLFFAKKTKVHVPGYRCLLEENDGTHTGH